MSNEVILESRSANLRHQYILEQLFSHGQVFVQDLAEHFNVAQETIRRDLNKLESMKLLKKVHGGAVNVQSKFERQFNARAELAQDEKRAIAKCAARFVKPGDTLFLDFGTTTLEFCQQLKAVNQITVITNSPMLAGLLQENPSIEVILIGGQFIHSKYACLGAIAQKNTADLFADYAVIGVGAVDIEKGVMDQNIDEAAMAQIMMENSRRLIVLADSSKLHKNAVARVTHWSNVDILIVGGEEDAWAERLRQQGVEVHFAGQ